MKTLFPILVCAMILAYATEKTTVYRNGTMSRRSSTNRLLYVMLLLTAILPVGMRRIFNDTGSYIRGFEESMTLLELLNSGTLELLGNPAFKIFTALVRSLTDNYHIYFMIAAIFVQYAYISTIRRYSYSFTLGVGLYICLGTYVFSIAAMKQTIAMGILMLAIPSLLKKRYVKFYILVFIAFLFHTYAIAFVILPLLCSKPWRIQTFIIIVVMIMIMSNFESVIGSFLDYANESGKEVAEYEVFDDASVNIFRVMVYGVVPVISLMFKRYLFGVENAPKEYELFVHMAIVSWAIMMLGTVSGANMFARMAFYFEFGIILSLPWIIGKVFTRKSATLVFGVAGICFFIYFFYANAVALDFDEQYRAVSLWEFFQPILLGGKV